MNEQEQALYDDIMLDLRQQSDSDIRERRDTTMEQELIAAYAYSDDRFYWYCEEHYCSTRHITIEELSEAVNNGLVATINENTIQYEQYAGEEIPLEGVYCLCCGAELYPAMEEEEE